MEKNAEATGPDAAYANHVDVRWHEAPRDKTFGGATFGLQTLREVDQTKYEMLVGDVEPSPSEASEEEDIEDRTEFALENYLEDFIVTNFASIFGKDLILCKDPLDGANGQQYATEIGTIDILL
ncbi:MAG: hypothetical protein HY321_19030 [Armatimonadetes bacterium]|nr:hypothetical protein [Armatimonadota bacterium]